MVNLKITDWLQVLSIGVPVSNVTATAAERCCERSQRCPNE
ncbi:MAG: hypothetical protein ABIM20_04145 [candidate division WOR-3 bacterium]